MIAGIACLAVAGLALLLAGSPSRPGATAHPARQLAYDVVGSYPHDPNAFLQGLLWYDGGFYESTGLEGRSSLRRVEFPSGKVLKSISIAPEFFCEGLALVDNRLIQLTWQSHRGFVYDRESFHKVGEFKYDTEGWGLTYDGTNLVMSDGSSQLAILDPKTFQTLRRLPVTFNGAPLTNLNELEFIEGEIWANVWKTDQIVCINPVTGQVDEFLDLTSILPASERTGREDVMNGIAYDPQTKRIFVSGKWWSKLFEIRVRH